MHNDYVVSWNHTKEQVIPIHQAELLSGLMRWKTVKKGEFLIGRQILANDPLLMNPNQTQNYILETFMQLLPLYKQAYSVHEL